MVTRLVKQFKGNNVGILTIGHTAITVLMGKELFQISMRRRNSLRLSIHLRFSKAISKSLSLCIRRWITITPPRNRGNNGANTISGKLIQ